MPTTIEIFCCYAREDQDLMKKLRTHLMPLQRRSLIKLWSDIDINAGDEWEEEIQKHLDTAHMILLLVSPDFMASDYCYSTEMEYALQRHEKQEARVIPIILRPTAWKGAPFDKIQVLPANARPVTDARSWISIDEALNDVTEKIGPIVTELLLPLYIDEAQQLVKNGRQEDALVIYERTLRLEPEYVPALYGKGATLFLLKRYEESVTAYDRAIQASAHPDARYHYGKASALRKLERYEESLAAYDEAIRLNPRRARVYKEKGELLLELERYAEALPVYEQLNKRDPENAAYYVQTGDILLELKRYIEALVVYEKAIQLDPDETYNEPSYHKKGELLLRLRRFEAAVATYEQAIILNPQNALYHQNKARALLELKRYEETLAAYERCIQLSKNPYCYHGKGQALLGLERYEEALVAYNEAIRLSDPHVDPMFYHDKGLVYKRLTELAYEMEKQARIHWNSRESSYISFVVPVITEEFHLLCTLHTSMVTSVAIRVDDQIIATGHFNGAIKVWYLPTGKELITFTPHSGVVWAIAFTSDGAFASSSWDATIKLWNTDEHLGVRELHTLTGHIDGVRSLSISRDGHILASGSDDNTIKLWNLDTGQELRTLTGHSARVLSVALGPDGQTIASGGWDSTIKLWNLHSGKELRTFTGHSNYVYSVAISPDGHLLASGSRDCTIKLWNLHTGQELLTLRGHTHAVHSVAFSPDGQSLASSSEDQTIKLWDLYTGKELCTITSHSSPIWGVIFSPDGQFLISRDNNTINVWEKK